MKFKKNQKVVKVIRGAGFEIGSYYWVVGKNKNKDYISVADEEGGEPYGHYDLHSYHSETGKAFKNNIPGFTSYLLTLDEAKNIEME